MGTPDSLTSRRRLTGDVKAAVEGASEAGATAFVARDAPYRRPVRGNAAHLGSDGVFESAPGRGGEV